MNQNEITYDVIIVGGGPTGVALGLELGLNNVNTLILEKYAEPLLSPRAQSLTARSLEFFMRWKLDALLKSKQLLPPDYPMQGVWCSTLNGTTYSVSGSNDQLNDSISPHKGIRVPLWITEDVLRSGLQDFPTIQFLKQQAVMDVQLEENIIKVVSKNNANQEAVYRSKYIVACDGANSIVRQKLDIPFEVLAPPQRVINIVFESSELEKLITVEKGFIYFLLESKKPGALGIIDSNRGLWYAQVRGDMVADKIEQVDLDQVLEEMTGLSFQKKIIQAHFWNMHIQLATTFSKENRAFLVGDSAHAFSPTGGYGLNTGFGDVVNLGWKLASVIKDHANPKLLETYEQERRPICVRNLNAAQKNADDMMGLRKKYDPKLNPEAFAKANSVLAKQHTLSLGATMGYAYFDSSLTVLQPGQSTQPMNPMHYQPITAPGYFLPHSWIDEKSRQSIYDVLSAHRWTLILSGSSESDAIQFWKNEFEKNIFQLDVLKLENNAYGSNYILVRPDWHIVFAGNELSSEIIERLGFLR